MKKNSSKYKLVSECCNARLKVVGIPDFFGDEQRGKCPITLHYKCTKCGRSCNYIAEVKKKEMNTLADWWRAFSSLYNPTKKQKQRMKRNIFKEIKKDKEMKPLGQCFHCEKIFFLELLQEANIPESTSSCFSHQSLKICPSCIKKIEKRGTKNE